MNALLLAQVGAWSIGQLAIFVIVICGIVGIVLVVSKQMGVSVPPFLVKILWIIFAVIVGVVAVKFLLSVV